MDDMGMLLHISFTFWNRVFFMLSGGIVPVSYLCSWHVRFLVHSADVWTMSCRIYEGGTIQIIGFQGWGDSYID